MQLALEQALRSKAGGDVPFGACIVKDGEVIAVAENSELRCHDVTKHAEVNAILNAITRDLSDCRLYVGLFPCNECTKVIIQAGIKEIIYLSDKYSHTDSVRAAKRMLDMSKTGYRQFVPSRQSVHISFQLD